MTPPRDQPETLPAPPGTYDELETCDASRPCGECADCCDTGRHEHGCTCPECDDEDDGPTAAELRDHDAREYAAMVRASLRAW